VRYDPVVQPGQTIADRYEVEEVLAQGGMATVFRVRHTQLQSRHALKVLDLSTKNVRTRLLQEGRIQASLRHPNIVAVTDVLDVEGHPALVMEFVEGPTLTQLLAESPPSLEQAEAWFRAIVAAVSFAHSRGLVHRDIKPDNILMAPYDEGYLPKVADFGIAKVLGDAIAKEKGPGTRAGLAMGTPSYMPPEQIDNAAEVDHRADVFALGCVLYEMVCGRQAFDGDNMMEVLTAITQGRYIPPGDVRPDLPARIVRAIESALEPRADARTPDCRTLLEHLDTEVAPTRTEETWHEAAMPDVPPPVERAPSAPVEAPAPSRLPWFALLLSSTALVLALGALAVVGLAAAGGIAWFVVRDDAVHLHEADTGVDDFEEDVAVPMDAVPRPPPEQPPDWRVEFHGWTTQERVREGVLKYAPERGGVLYLVDVTVENLTGEQQIPGFSWTMLDSDGTEYDAPLGCHMALKGSVDPAAIYEAGQVLSGPVCFDGPKNTRGLRVRFAPISGSDPPHETLLDPM
jgi:serine/threonine-protein kinase